MSCVMVSVPNAPEPFARTERSGMLLEQERPASAGVDGILAVSHGIACRRDQLLEWLWVHSFVSLFAVDTEPYPAPLLKY